MNIGIFGDSFVDKSHRNMEKPSWWVYLEKKHGHKVECFGEGGSGIDYSAQLILEKYQNYDFVIWAVSNPPRITVRHRADFKDTSIHVTGRHLTVNDNFEIQEKIRVTEEYLLKVYDSIDGNFVSKCIIKHVESTVPNMLMIPCFVDPWTSQWGNPIDFNLFDLCQQETNYYFPNIELADLYDNYIDTRVGHFSHSTHLILADLVAANLTPGIFRADYSKFPKPTDSISESFVRK